MNLLHLDDKSAIASTHTVRKAEASTIWRAVAAVSLGVCLPILFLGHGRSVRAAMEPEHITIDSPLNGSVFPPDMAAPTFQWRDPAAQTNEWRIEVSFASGAAAMQFESKGEPMKIGEIDPRCVSNTNKLPELTPEQAAAHTWKPDALTWAAIRKQAGAGAVTVTIRGMAEKGEVSRGEMAMLMSADPVAAPIFYRDVPLMPSETEQGFIKPLATTALPLIEWRMRNVSETGSHVVMTDLHSCANCHSFAANGKTLGLDHGRAAERQGSVCHGSGGKAYDDPQPGRLELVGVPGRGVDPGAGGVHVADIAGWPVRGDDDAAAGD